VIDDLGEHGRVWRETDAEAIDFKTVITDCWTANTTTRSAIAFNTAEGWSRGVSEDIAHELRRRGDLQLTDLPDCSGLRRKARGQRSAAVWSRGRHTSGGG
jgi:hypothetical protein